MEQGRNYHNKCSIFKRLKKNRASEEKLEAYLLEYMQKHPELTPEPPSPPPGEFQLIIEEMKRRGSTTVLAKQLKLLDKYRRLVYYLHKPFMVSMVICVIFSVTSIGVCANKPGRFPVERVKNIETKIWHNDDALCITKADLPTVETYRSYSDEETVKSFSNNHEIKNNSEHNWKNTHEPLYLMPSY
jgi:hypothetical protein